MANKIAVITGASKGLGQEIAYQFVRDLGLDVVLVARGDCKQTEERIAALNKPECRVLSVACDISDPEKVAEMKKKVDEFGGCDILINNAGIYPSGNERKRMGQSGKYYVGFLYEWSGAKTFWLYLNQRCCYRSDQSSCF